MSLEKVFSFAITLRRDIYRYYSQAKRTNGHKYWYIVESRRVNGKPRPIVLAYLGKANDLLRRLQGLRVREKITLQSIALRFRPDLVDLIGLDRKRSLSYTEDSVREDRTKMT